MTAHLKVKELGNTKKYVSEHIETVAPVKKAAKKAVKADKNEKEDDDEWHLKPGDNYQYLRTSYTHDKLLFIFKKYNN